MKKIVCLCTIFLMMVAVTIPAFASESVRTKVPEQSLDQYLIEAGYPISFISEIDTVEKLHLYEGQYSFESSNDIQGVFTENYHIEYRLNSDGTINIDPDDSDEFIKLMNNSEEIKKILLSQNMVSSLGRMTTIDSLQERISEIQELPQEAALKSLSNWRASITCSHKSYTNGVAKKHLTYSWKWSYAPTWTLTDKVAMAWSGNFTAEPRTIYWTYKKNVGFTGSQIHVNYYDESAYGYDDYDCNAGCAKGIDIKGTVPGTYNRYHAGTLSADITKVTDTNSRESAIGRYYHKKITPGLSLAFSQTGPSISVSAGSNYDQSKDSATAFWATTP